MCKEERAWGGREREAKQHPRHHTGFMQPRLAAHRRSASDLPPASRRDKERDSNLNLAPARMADGVSNHTCLLHARKPRADDGAMCRGGQRSSTAPSFAAFAACTHPRHACRGTARIQLSPPCLAAPFTFVCTAAAGDSSCPHPSQTLAQARGLPRPSARAHPLHTRTRVKGVSEK